MMILLLLVALATAETVTYCQKEDLGEMGKFVQQMTLSGPNCIKSTIQAGVDLMGPCDRDRKHYTICDRKVELTECAFTNTVCDLPTPDMDDESEYGYETRRPMGELTSMCTIENYKKEIPDTMEAQGIDTCEKYLAAMEISWPCDQAQTEAWEKAWVDKVAEGGDVADACNAIPEGEFYFLHGKVGERACTCMNAFEMPPPDCAYKGNNINEHWKECKAEIIQPSKAPSDECSTAVILKLPTLSKIGTDAGGDCTEYDKMVTAGMTGDSLPSPTQAEMGKMLCDCVGKIPDADFKEFDCDTDSTPNSQNVYQYAKELCGGKMAQCELESCYAPADKACKFEENGFKGWDKGEYCGESASTECREAVREWWLCYKTRCYPEDPNYEMAQAANENCNPADSFWKKTLFEKIGERPLACEDVPGATVTIDKKELDCARIKGDDCYDNLPFGGRHEEMLLEIMTKCRHSCAGTRFKGIGKTVLDLVAKGVLKVVEDAGEHGKNAELTCPAGETDGGKVAMKKLKFKQTVTGITKEQCAGVKGAIRKGTAKQLKIAEEGVTVKEEGAGICVDVRRRRLKTGSQAFAVEAEVESSKVEEAKKTVASDDFKAAIVSEASQGGVKDLKMNKIEVDGVEDEQDGVFAFGTIVFGVFALLL